MSMPILIYGTAWKKERTASLVRAALDAGFRAVDCAAQPKHYNQSGTGAGVVAWLGATGALRASLFLQSKFTPIDGQDCSQPLPYDSSAPLAEQVSASIASSLADFATPYLDSILLHAPCRHFEDTLAVWRAFEAAHAQGRVRALGVSNMYDASVLARLWDAAAVKPASVQNRFYAETQYDADVRAFCTDKGIAYQSFWTLTANPRLLASPLLRRLAAARGGTPAQALFRMLLQLDISPLCGSCNTAHMREAVAAAAWPPFAAADAAAFTALLKEESGGGGGGGGGGSEER